MRSTSVKTVGIYVSHLPGKDTFQGFVENISHYFYSISLIATPLYFAIYLQLLRGTFSFWVLFCSNHSNLFFLIILLKGNFFAIHTWTFLVFHSYSNDKGITKNLIKFVVQHKYLSNMVQLHVGLFYCINLEYYLMHEEDYL